MQLLRSLGLESTLFARLRSQKVGAPQLKAKDLCNIDKPFYIFWR